MADLSLVYSGMSDTRLETGDETAVTISVTNNTGRDVVLTKLECGMDDPRMGEMEFSTPQNPTYSDPHESDLTGANLVLAPGATRQLIVRVRTGEDIDVGEIPVGIGVHYEFVSPSGACSTRIMIPVSKD